MPLVHPSAEPEQPHGHGRYDDDDVPDLGIVLREPAGQPRREDESEEDDSHDQVEDCAGGDLTWDCHHGWLLSLGLGAACCAWVCTTFMLACLVQFFVSHTALSFLSPGGLASSLEKVAKLSLIHIFSNVLYCRV